MQNIKLRLCYPSDGYPIPNGKEVSIDPGLISDIRWFSFVGGSIIDMWDGTQHLVYEKPNAIALMMQGELNAV